MIFGKKNAIARTDPTSYTPTLSNNTNVSANTAYWSRDGRFLLAEGVVTWSGAGGGGTFTASLPSGLVIDTTNLSGGASATAMGASRIGNTTFYNAGTATFSGPTYLLTTTTLQFFTTIALPGTIFANGDGLKWTLRVPIVGWS